MMVTVITNCANENFICCVSLLFIFNLLFSYFITYSKGRGDSFGTSNLQFSQSFFSSLFLPLSLPLKLNTPGIYTEKDTRKKEILERSLLPTSKLLSVILGTHPREVVQDPHISVTSHKCTTVDQAIKRSNGLCVNIFYRIEIGQFSSCWFVF